MEVISIIAFVTGGTQWFKKLTGVTDDKLIIGWSFLLGGFATVMQLFFPAYWEALIGLVATVAGSGNLGVLFELIKRFKKPSGQPPPPNA